MTAACPAGASRWVRAAMVRGMTRPAAARTAAVASTGAAFTLLPFGRSGSVNALSGRGQPKRLPCGTEREGHNHATCGNLFAGRGHIVRNT